MIAYTNKKGKWLLQNLKSNLALRMIFGFQLLYQTLYLNCYLAPMLFTSNFLFLYLHNYYESAKEEHRGISVVNLWEKKINLKNLMFGLWPFKSGSSVKTLMCAYGVISSEYPSSNLSLRLRARNLRKAWVQSMELCVFISIFDRLPLWLFSH